MKIVVDDSVPNPQPAAAAAENRGELAGREVSPAAQNAHFNAAIFSLIETCIAASAEARSQATACEALPITATVSPLPPELDLLVSSYIEPSDAHRLGTAANWEFESIPPMVRPSVRVQALTVQTLSRTNRNITDADLTNLRRDFPGLVALDVTGATYNGTRDFGPRDIAGDYTSPHHYVRVIGAPTLDERIAQLTRELEQHEMSLSQLRASHANLCSLMASMTMSGGGAAIDTSQIDGQIAATSTAIEAIQARLTRRYAEKIIVQVNEMTQMIARL